MVHIKIEGHILKCPTQTCYFLLVLRRANGLWGSWRWWIGHNWYLYWETCSVFLQWPEYVRPPLSPCHGTLQGNLTNTEWVAIFPTCQQPKEKDVDEDSKGRDPRGYGVIPDVEQAFGNPICCASSTIFLGWEPYGKKNTVIKHRKKTSPT